MFDGDESRYELWEVKFIAHLHLQKLHDVVLPAAEGGLTDEAALLQQTS